MKRKTRRTPKRLKREIRVYVYCVGGDAHERGHHSSCKRCGGTCFHRLW